MSAADWTALKLTMQLAATSTAILLLLGLPLAWWLARRRRPGQALVEAVVALPLVLPPTVLGFYLLLALSPQGVLGGPWLALSGQLLAFSFTGLLIGSVLYSLPFVVQPLQAAFEQLPPRVLDAAATLGAGPMERFFTVALPLIKRSLVTAASLGFAHTVGEFGVVLMIGGNIPGETQTLSIALYDRIETLQYDSAHRLAAGLLVFSFLLLVALYAGKGRFQLR